MKYWLVTSMLLALNFYAYSQEEIEFTYHSYSEFVALIQQEEDTIFNYSDAIISFNPETDQRFKVYYIKSDSLFTQFPVDSLIINKHIKLNNVHFSTDIHNSLDTLNGKVLNSFIGVFYRTSFNKSVDIRQCTSFRVVNSRIKSRFVYVNRAFQPPIELGKISTWQAMTQVENCKVTSVLGVWVEWEDEENESRLIIRNNEIITDDLRNSSSFFVQTENLRHLIIDQNTIQSSGIAQIKSVSAQWIAIRENAFDAITLIEPNIYGWSRIQFFDNHFPKTVQVTITKLNRVDIAIGWAQFENSVISSSGIGPYVTSLYDQGLLTQGNGKVYTHRFRRNYIDSVRHINNDAYTGEMSFHGMMHDHYQSNHDTEKANQVFIALKDLETKRLAYHYQQNPKFRTYFKWKINQFLKLFVDYGTEPAKAIVFAVYVIVFFALIYLFFPNSWDGQGRTRIMNRLRFFLKYSKQDEGAKEVYLEERRAELVPFEEFKAYFEEHGKKAPRFFYAVAMPLYKWSVSGTRLVSGLLGSVDVLKGTWENTPKSQRWVKSTLVIGAFLIALLYDLFIKVLNAVMLSINTFTTLGFGEIPIKGLPRYLAIIQGFIGWFMLTIFSVSLISQLLN